jgi:hypothetical protein
VEILENKGLVIRHMDDTGSFIKASDPANFEIELSSEEERLKGKRDLLNELVPALNAFKKNDSSLFSVRTFEGESGFRQMAWHDLKAKTDLLCLGFVEVETLINDHRWSELHRKMTVEAGFNVKEIVNDKTDVLAFTKNKDYMKRYFCRSIPKSILPLDNQIAIYNNVVAIYHWREGRAVGVEIVSETYAQTMRAVFEHYWEMSTAVKVLED